MVGDTWVLYYDEDPNLTFPVVSLDQYFVCKAVEEVGCSEEEGGGKEVQCRGRSVWVVDVPPLLDFFFGVVRHLGLLVLRPGVSN